MSKITVEKTARIETFGNPDASNLWIVLHGYGHLVTYFIKKFELLDENKNFVVAPEGLHRFYLDGTSGRVGASWMTKEEREDDIHDYISYLNKVYQMFEGGNRKHVILLGFSQGVATASRWLEMGDGKGINVYINWAGVFPPDLNTGRLKRLKTTKNYFVCGNNDPYFNEDIIQRQRMDFENKELDFTYLSFEGKHDIDKDILRVIERELE